MTSLAELEKWRAALALNAASVENLVQSASGGALLGMLNSLTSRLNDLESQAGTTRKIEAADLTFNLHKLDQLKADIASLGQITKSTTMPTTGQQPTQPAPATSTATTATTRRTADKPRGAELAKVLRVGDRVKPAGSPGFRTGTVTAFPSTMGFFDPASMVDVKWDDGRESFHYMGYIDMYDLDLL